MGGPCAVVDEPVLTFLFTDVEGSSRLWEEDPEAMSGWLAGHDAIIRQAVEDHGGRVFATAGDSFASVFASALGAVSAAAEMQQRLAEDASSELAVRIGMHSGEAEQRGGDFFGPVLNRGARLRDAAHGGQVLVSGVTRSLIEEAPAGVDFVDLGDHRLRDLAGPEQVFELQIAGVDGAFPPIRSLGAFIHNLPTQFTSFVGRTEEIRVIDKLLSDTRHATLVGPGGTGKTRLGLQAAAEFLERYPDGVWYVDLRSVDDGAELPRLVASTMRVVLGGDRPIADQVIDAIIHRQLLVLLDNCEHVLEAAASLVHPLLRRQGNVHVMVTTRQALGIPGESLLNVEPLPVAADELVGESDALRLFADRAETAQPTFRLDDHRQAVLEICQAVDGLPLAVELAAARLRAVSATELVERLDDQLRMLRTSHTTGDQRHATMEATIAWSWGLLEPDEQTLFARLAFFPGTWSLDAAEAICGYDPIDQHTVLDLQTSLLDKSLITLDDTSGPVTRYRMLEPIRQYGVAQLTEPERQQLRNQHIGHWRQAFPSSSILERPFGVNQQVHIERNARIAADTPNLMAAMEWALEAERWEDAMGILGGGLGEILWLDGHGYEPVLGWLGRTLDHAGEIELGTFLGALDWAACVAAAAGQNEKWIEWVRLGAEMAPSVELRHHFQLGEGTALGRVWRHEEAHTLLDKIIAESDVPGMRASALFAKSESTLGPQAWQLIQSALDEAPVEDLWHESGFAWWVIAEAADTSGEYAASTDAAEKSLRESTRLQFNVLASHAAATLARLQADQGYLEEAERTIEGAIPTVRRLFDVSSITMPQILVMAGEIARRRGELDEAERYMEEAHRASDASGLPGVWVRMMRAILARDQGRFEEAHRLLSEATERCPQDSKTSALREIHHIEATIALRDQAGQRALELLKDVLPKEDAHAATIQKLETAAIAFVQNGRHQPAARIIGFIESERERTGLVIQPPDRPIWEKAIEEGQHQMGKDWDAAIETGASMTLDEAIDYAREQIGHDPAD